MTQADPNLPPPGYARCEITGKVVPESETVVIQGTRVCAEGKELLLEQLRSGATAPGELERPGFWRRFLCSLLDGIILGIGGAVIGGIVGVIIGVAAGVTGGNQVAMMGANLAGSLLGAAISIAYFTLLHANNGQSLGKMAGKTKVVRLDGSPIDMSTALIRALAFSGPQIIPAVVGFAVLLVAGAQPAAVAVMVLSLVIGLYGLANAICLIVDSKTQRALHDLIAGTRVILLPR